MVRRIFFLLRHLPPPPYQSLKCPSLAIYPVPDSPSTSLPWYGLADSSGRAMIAQRFPLDRAVRSAAISQYRDEALSAHVLELHNANHYVFLSNRDEVLSAIRQFLATLSGGKGARAGEFVRAGRRIETPVPIPVRVPVEGRHAGTAWRKGRGPRCRSYRPFLRVRETIEHGPLICGQGYGALGRLLQETAHLFAIDGMEVLEADCPPPFEGGPRGLGADRGRSPAPRGLRARRERNSSPRR